MEHRLIRGGEQWLPFARSRIKALQATGQQYASQKFVLDGSTIRVRISPGNEYIEIDGDGRCIFKMDSGVIEVRNANPENDLAYEPGTYYDTTRTTEYNASFTTPSEDGEWLTHPVPANDNGFVGQLSGDVTYSNGFRGALPSDRTFPKSFTPRKDGKNEDGSDKYDARDSVLVAKKATIEKFPASCWSGKMRLYVQAMYGQELYTYSADGEASENTGCAAWEYDIPGLYISGYKVGTEPPASIPVNVSAGVILAEDGTHWLVSIGDNALVFYPLRGSRCAESARKFLKTGSSLPDLEKEHLEAYILSTCRPVVAQAQTVVCEFGGASISMGYGFHWNWRGTAADIVTNIEEFQGSYTLGAPNMRMSSTHWRITPSSTKVNGVKKWSATAEIIEGPVVWTVLRSVWSVHYPSWGIVKGSTKLFPRYSVLEDSADAPFYAFYKKDDLQVCRYSRKKIPAGPVVREGTLLGGRPCDPTYFFCEGDLPSYYKWSDAGAAYSKVSFSVGEVAYETIAYGLTTTGQRGSFNSTSAPVPKTAAEILASSPSFINYFTPGEAVPMTTGYPSAYQTEYAIAPVSITQGYRAEIEMLVTTDFTSESMMGYVMVIVPFFDAEAVYYHNWERQDLNSTGAEVVDITSTSNATYDYAFVGSAKTGDYLYYSYGPSIDTIVNSVTNPPDSSGVVLDTTKQILHCGAGAIVTADMFGTVDGFADINEDTALAYLATKTSASSGEDATVFGTYVIPPKNSTLTTADLAAIVGWA